MQFTKQDSLEHMDIRGACGLDGRQLEVVLQKMTDNYARDGGKLKGCGEAFKKAEEVSGINAVYLISCCLAETGYGNSFVGKVVLDKNKKKTIVYNAYGYGANDNDPDHQYAYTSWNSRQKAIIGGAYAIKQSFIDQGLITPYLMRWNPFWNPGSGDTPPNLLRRYATQVNWSNVRAELMYTMYEFLEKIDIESPPRQFIQVQYKNAG